MLHTIGFFRFFCIVPPIHSADQVAGDPADPLKGGQAQNDNADQHSPRLL